MPFSGEVIRKRNYKRNIDGTVAFIGNIGVGTKFKRSAAGVLTFTGDITSLYNKRVLNGVIKFSGSVTRVINGIPVKTFKMAAMRMLQLLSTNK